MPCRVLQELDILAICHGGGGLEPWQGMDLPVLAADKVARALPDVKVSVGIGGVKRSRAEKTREYLLNLLPSDHSLTVTVQAYDDLSDILVDIEVGCQR